MHQWYWSYEYSTDWDDTSTNSDVEFDSYMIPEEDLELGEFRLLKVDNPLYLPTHYHIRFILTAADVMHAWAIPSLGIKMDCIPGRLNQTSVLINRTGKYYGQCSELCGVNHGFMPIEIIALPLDKFLVNNNKN